MLFVVRLNGKKEEKKNYEKNTREKTENSAMLKEMNRIKKYHNIIQGSLLGYHFTCNFSPLFFFLLVICHLSFVL